MTIFSPSFLGKQKSTCQNGNPIGLEARRRGEFGEEKCEQANNETSYIALILSQPTERDSLFALVLKMMNETMQIYLAFTYVE